ncbi:hypothetical protein IB227_02060 [Stenotrophomonas sp. STM01]|uniref:hypothetical protein n=1 Tax=Stenotrophomonas sp. STM01 TaxID=2769278 RepID=UPI00177DD8B1|nr:hypothetical protein [Stenotrophomonas sp. STM01]MBD9534633.1 hypothetical protein [Stenotrophomonas sp. STM01]
MARKILPLTCDCCGKGIEDMLQISRSMRDTRAAGFRYDMCLECAIELEEAEPEVRELACRRAMVNHAARCSPEFGQFVADWFDVDPPEAPMQLPAAA